jgi:hypothetical protein
VLPELDHFDATYDKESASNDAVESVDASVDWSTGQET